VHQQILWLVWMSSFHCDMTKPVRQQSGTPGEAKTYSSSITRFFVFFCIFAVNV